MSGHTIPSGDLIAHQPPMRLIDRVIAVSETHALAEAVIGPDHPFIVAEQGVPAYVGLEMMAQTIAAVDGLIRRNSGKPPKIGFLLGCRRYRADRSYFRLGESLRISADLVFTDGAMFSFECQISLAAGGEIARARLNVYAPDDPQRLMKARLE